MLGQFLIAAPIYMVKKTPSNKTLPADITVVGLISNTHFTLVTGKGWHKWHSQEDLEIPAVSHNSLCIS